MQCERDKTCLIFLRSSWVSALELFSVCSWALPELSISFLGVFAIGVGGIKKMPFIPVAREQKFINSMRVKGRIFVDVGANWGCWCLHLARDFDRILAFEPDPRVFPILKKNIERRKFNNIIPLQIALGDQSGTKKLFLFKITHSSLKPEFQMKRTNIGKIPPFVIVSVSLLDSFFSSNREQVDLIKIDTEGFEVEVLEGARKTIEEGNPSLFIEYHSNRNAEKIIKMFPSIKFKRIAREHRGWLVHKK